MISHIIHYGKTDAHILQLDKLAYN